MSARDLAALLLLAAIWGASFLFIKIGVEAVPPLLVVEGRVVLGAATVLLFALLAGQHGLLAALRRPGTFAVGVINTAAPFLLISWGETRIPSGVAAIINATAPLFSALIVVALLRHRVEERLSGWRTAGLLCGFCGVVVLIAGEGVSGAVDPVGMLVTLGGPLLYAVGTLMARRVFAGDSPLVPAATTSVAAALVLLPVTAAFGRPSGGVPLGAALAIAALGIGGTGIAYILSFRLLASLGATASLTVTYLLPAFALVYGRLFLGEPVAPLSLLALVLILGGVFLAGRRARASQAPETIAGEAVPADVEPELSR